MAPIITYVAAFLIEYVGFNYAVAMVVAEVFVYAAATEIINTISGSDSSANSIPGSGAGLGVNYASTDASARIIFGTVRCGGMETLPPITSGANGELLQKCLTIAGHQIDSYGTATLGAYYLDDVQIPTASVGAIAGNVNDGVLSTTKFSGVAWIRGYTGASTETVDYIFQQAVIQPSFLGKGLAKVFFTFKFNTDIYKGIPFPTVIPNGARVYDPRLDTTNGGSGAHRYATPSTWEFVHGAETYNSQSIGSNPALCLAYYLMSIMGGEVDPVEIDWTTVIAAANVCDAQVNIPNGSGGSTTQDRYTCNGVLSASVQDWTDNIKPLADAMLGNVILANGVWRMYAGGWQTPTTSILKSDWVSGCQFTFDGGRDSRFNRSRCFFMDGVQNYTRQECFARSNATYKAADGNEDIDLVTQQLLTTNEYEAQRKAEFLLHGSRNQVQISGKLPPRFQGLLMWDTVTVTYDVFGWVSKTFRVVALKINIDGSVDVGLREEQDTDWTDPLYTDYGVPSTQALPTINPTTPTEPTSLTLAPLLNGSVLFDWGRPIIEPTNTIYRLIRSTNSANAAVGTVVWQGNARQVALIVPTSDHWYYVQTQANSYLSLYQPNTFGIYGAAPTPIAVRSEFERLIPDPHFELAAFGRFWTQVNTFTSIASLTLTGGYAGGGKLTVTMSGQNFTTFSPVIAIPNSAYTRNRPGTVILGMTARITSLVHSAFTNGNDGVLLTLIPWTGVGSPNITNTSPFAGSASCMADTWLLQAQPLNTWLTFFTPTSVYNPYTSGGAGADVNSYPYLVAYLQPVRNDIATRQFEGSIEIGEVVVK